MWHYPPHLWHVVRLPWEIKMQIFCRYSADMEENANNLYYKYTDFNSPTHVTVYSECVFIKILSSSLNSMLIVDKHCCDEFLVSQTDCYVKQVKEQWHWKFYLPSVSLCGKICYFKHRKYQNLRMNNKARSDKNTICLCFLPYLLNICRKFEFLISQGM